MAYNKFFNVYGKKHKYLYAKFETKKKGTKFQCKYPV